MMMPYRIPRGRSDIKMVGRMFKGVRTIFKLCPGENCGSYGMIIGKKKRKCYYGDPQCWRGEVDRMIEMIVMWFRRKER